MTYLNPVSTTAKFSSSEIYTGQPSSPTMTLSPPAKQNLQAKNLPQNEG
jgi:hypothetical protein